MRDLLQAVKVGSAAELEPACGRSRRGDAADADPGAAVTRLQLAAVPPIVIGKDLAETLGARWGIRCW